MMTAGAPRAHRFAQGASEAGRSRKERLKQRCFAAHSQPDSQLVTASSNLLNGCSLFSLLQHTADGILTSVILCSSEFSAACRFNQRGQPETFLLCRCLSILTVHVWFAYLSAQCFLWPLAEAVNESKPMDCKDRSMVDLLAYDHDDAIFSGTFPVRGFGGMDAYIPLI